MNNQGQLSINIVIRAGLMRKTQNDASLGRKRGIRPVSSVKPDQVVANPAFPGTLRALARASSQETYVVLREYLLL
jgi:hypothetical protein